MSRMVGKGLLTALAGLIANYVRGCLVDGAGAGFLRRQDDHDAGRLRAWRWSRSDGTRLRQASPH